MDTPYPPTFLEALTDCTKYLDRATRDEEITKKHLIDGMNMRLSIIIGKMVSAPTGESFSIFNREERPQKA
jgi:hypothetical protein